MLPEQYLIALVILLSAYFIRGITGFGSGLIAIPLLAHFLPLSFVVPMMLAVDFLASVALSQARMQVRWDEVKSLIPSSAIGMLIGAPMLISLPHEPLLIGLAVFVMIFGVRYLFNIHGENPVSRWWSIPTGLSGGAIGAMFGTGGPPYVIYLSHRLHDKTQLRGTLSGLFMLEGAMRIIVFLFIGLLTQPDMLASILLAIPVMAAGLWLGQRVHMGISRPQQLAIIGVLLIISGGSLLARVWLQ